MNKTELASKVAEDVGITKVQATAAIESIIEAIAKTLRSGERFALIGFGTLSVVKRAAYKGHNPRTGETIKVKAKKVAKFKASKELTDKL